MSKNKIYENSSLLSFVSRKKKTNKILNTDENAFTNFFSSNTRWWATWWRVEEDAIRGKEQEEGEHCDVQRSVTR